MKIIDKYEYLNKNLNKKTNNMDKNYGYLIFKINEISIKLENNPPDSKLLEDINNFICKINRLLKKIIKIYNKPNFNKVGFINKYGKIMTSYLCYYEFLIREFCFYYKKDSQIKKINSFMFKEYLKNKKIDLNMLLYVLFTIKEENYTISYKEIIRLVKSYYTLEDSFKLFVISSNENILNKIKNTTKLKNLEKMISKYLYKTIIRREDDILISKPQMKDLLSIMNKHLHKRERNVLLAVLLNKRKDNSKLYTIKTNASYLKFKLKCNKNAYSLSLDQKIKEYLDNIKIWSFYFLYENNRLPLMLKDDSVLDNNFIFEKGISVSNSIVLKLLEKGLIKKAIAIDTFTKLIKNESETEIKRILKRRIELNLNTKKYLNKEQIIMIIEYVTAYLKKDKIKFLGILPYIECYIRNILLKSSEKNNVYNKADLNTKSISSFLKDISMVDVLKEIIPPKIIIYFDILFSNEGLNLKNNYSHCLFKDKNQMSTYSDILFIFVIKLFF